jgi:hypothetical protein
MTTCGDGAKTFNRLHPTASKLKKMKKIVALIGTIPEYIPKNHSNKNHGKTLQERQIRLSLPRSGRNRS